MKHCRWFLLAGILFSSPLLAADEGIPEKKLEALKAATVYVKVEGKQGSATGSGFLIHVDGETGLVATNRHVVAEIKGRFTPKKYSLVFSSGTRKEQVLSGEIVAIDPDQDLAVLKVTSKNLPAPLDLAPTKLRETMTIYTFGFPLGDALSTDRPNPNVTIGKGTIGSLPEDSRGKLKHIQLDGELNPGNSGGPVVDADGKLVGIAVAKIVGTKISFAIPTAELIDLLKGRAAAIVLRSIRVDKDSAEVEIEIPLIDPMRKLKTVEIRHVRKDGLKELPEADKTGNWPDLPGAETVAVKIENGKAIARVTLRSMEKKSFDYYFQSAYTIGDGKPVGTQPITQKIEFARMGLVRLDGSPPWKTIVSKEGGFTIDMPATPLIHESSTEKVGGLSAKSFILGCTTENGVYLAHRIDLPGKLPRGIEDKLYDSLRDFFAEQWNGKVINEKKVRALGGSMGRDFTIRGKPDEKNLASIRVRQFLVGNSIFAVIVISPTIELPEDAERFLGSLALGTAKPRATEVPETEGKGAELKGWSTVIDPDKDCKLVSSDKGISFQVPGTLHDLFYPGGGATNAPRVLREVEGDFVATVKVCGEFKPGPRSTNPKSVPFHGGGFVLWNDSENFIRFERFAWLRGGKYTTGTIFSENVAGHAGPSQTEMLPAGDCYLRVERRGNRIVGAISSDGTKWKELKPIDNAWPKTLKVGLAAISTSSQPFTVDFEDFELKQKP